MSAKLYYHAGDIGDCVYGMVVPKLLGAGEVLLGAKHSFGEDLRPRLGFSPASFAFLAPLLRRQPYVHAVSFVYATPFCTHDLNTFRLHWRGKLCGRYAARGWKPPHSLQQMHLAAFDLSVDESQPWLEATPKWGPRVVLARSVRYHNDSFPWQRVVDKYRRVAAFVGTDRDYKEFCSAFGGVTRLEVSDAAEMAGYIATATLFVGNQSAPYAIAEGLKVRTIQETRATTDENGNGADCLFARPNAQFVRDGAVTLPDV